MARAARRWEIRAHERVMTAFYAVPDYVWQMAAVAQRHAQKMLSDHAGSKKGDAAYEGVEAFSKARAQQLEAKHFYDHKCSEFANAETYYESTTENGFEKAKALKRHMKTVTMRAESLAITEDDTNKTLTADYEEAQELMNVQLTACVSSLVAAPSAL